MADPTNLNAIDDLKFLTGYNIEPVIASETAIQTAIEKYYNAGPSYDEVMAGFDEAEIEFSGEEEDISLLELEKASEDAPVVRLVNMVLLNAIKKGASDIHIEPYEKKLRVRYRIDGVLAEEMTPPLKLKNAITSRLKIMSSLDIAERRLPQDGRIKLKLGRGREMDFRVSVLPTIWGEKVVMRLLDKGNLQLDMTKLGFDQKPLEDFKWAIGQPWGMVLVTGPTGSGKTTTLYSALAEINDPGINISTAEDPIEYDLAGVNQIQVHKDIGLDFARVLRSFLRQDPDVILVGETRDKETAHIAVEAALTGHLVFTTLHTNSAAGAFTRLGEMDVEPFLISSSTIGVMAQRLARRLCKTCREQYEADDQTCEYMGLRPKSVLWKGRGCGDCNGKGVKGRIGIYEVMKMNAELRQLVARNALTEDVHKIALAQGMLDLKKYSAILLLNGDTSVEEVLQVVSVQE
jgi:type IV pilus assembly protein PilB